MPRRAVTDLVKPNTTVAGAQFAPAVCALSGGGYVIVWRDDPSGSIYAQRFGATGQPVGTELHLDSAQGGSALWVSVAPTADNGFVIAFQAGFGAQAEIFARRYDSLDHPVGGLFAANTTSPNEQYNPHVTALDNGGLLFTWDTRVTLGSDVVAQEVRGRIYDSSGQPVGNDFTIAPMTATDQHALSAISSLPGGGFVVTWQRAKDDSGNFEIVGQRYNAGGGKTGAEFQANTQSANNQYGNDVARLSDGGFVVTWVDPAAGTGAGAGGRIVARHYDAGGNAIGGEILIDSKASGAYGRTVVTALADGAYVVGWTEDDGANDNVLARAIGANDVPLDAAFEMAFDSPFNANFFSDGAITLANGNVVFVWDGPSITPPGGPATGQDIYMRVYDFSGAGGPQPILGTPGADALSGTTGDDVIQGLAGNDVIEGRSGVDRMEGGLGDDIYYVHQAGDDPVEAAAEGQDAVYASISYVLPAGSSVELLSTISHAATTAIDLTGNALAQSLAGNAGANILDGGGGADMLFGYGGADTYRVDDAAVQVVEYVGGGSDRVETSVSYVLGGNAEVETLAVRDAGSTAAVNLTGNYFAQILIGNAGANILQGAGGADTLRGLGGNDTYYVDVAGVTIEEGAGGGADSVYVGLSYALGAGVEVERLSTNNHAATTAINLTGNATAQSVLGNAGANALDGGLGNDLLVGMGGADSFAFTTALGANNVDTVFDFVSGIDRIHLDDSVFAGIGGLGTLAAGAFVTGTAAADADDRIVYNVATGQLYFDADGNGAGAAVLFATLTGAPALAASDIIVI